MADQTIGSACTTGAGSALASYGGNNSWCNGTTWQFPAYQFGSSALSCTSSQAGTIQWTGSAFQGCNGTSWGPIDVSTSAALSSLLAATTTNSIDSGSWAQIWKWGTLTTQTALSLTSSSMTSGTLLSLSNAATGNNAGKVLSVTNAETGAAYGLYSSMSGAGNTGYAAYFSNTSTAGWALVAMGTSYFNGAVGIGTTAPANKLDVNGAMAIGSYAGTAAPSNGLIVSGVVGIGTTTPASTLGVSGGVAIGTTYAGTNAAGSNNLIVQGSVGIGTTSTSKLLNLQSATAGGAVINLFDTSVGSSASAIPTLQFGINANNGFLTSDAAQVWAQSIGGATAALNFAAYNNAAPTTSQMTLSNGNLSLTGSLGVGVGNPGTTLDVAGDIRHGNTFVHSLTRTVPTTIGNYIEIGSFAFSNGGGSIWVSITVPSNNYSVSKEYLLPVQYGETGNVWQTALPIASTGAFSGNDFALDVNVNASTTYLRLRDTTGTQGGTAYITLRHEGVNTDTFLATTATGSNTPTAYFNSTALTQTGGSVGIGTTSPTGLLSINSTTTGTGYGVYATDATTTNGYGVYSLNNGAGNTGYAGYFTNTGTGAVNYGLYASTSSSSGYAGYFQGAVNVNGALTVSSCSGCSSGAGVSLSSLTSATTTNAIDSGSNAQTWKWGTLSTQTALTLSTSSMTSGTLLNLADSSSSTSTGTVLSISDAETGTTYGLYSSLNGASNTGYAGYFSNSSAVGWALAATGTSYFNGNVGIGTSSPGTPLQIGPDLSFQYSWPAIGFNINAYTAHYMTSNHGAELQENYNNGYLSIIQYPSGTSGSSASGGASLFLTGSGYVGIGNGAPTATLDVMSTTTAAIFENPTYNNGYSSGTVVNIRNSGTATNDNYLLLTEGWTGTTGTNFGSLSYGANTSFAISNPSGNAVGLQPAGGNVGIGTTSPSDKLDVAGAIGLTATTATLPTNGVYSPAAGQLALTTSGNAALTITSTQSVGIGTATPAAKLQVAGGAVVGNDAAACTSTNAGELIWTGSAFEGCNGSSWQILSSVTAAYDLAVFMPNAPPANMIVRAVAERNGTFPAGLTGSGCVAKSGATSSAAITVNQVHSGTTTAVATITFAASGGSNQTCTFTAASTITVVPGDVIEFVFPSTPDATLANIAITLAGSHT